MGMTSTTTNTSRYPGLAWALALALLLMTPMVGAQEGRPDTRAVDQAEKAEPIPEPADQPARANWSVGSWGDRQGARDQSTDALPPFGYRLFDGGFRETRGDGRNDDYRVVPGDQVNLRVWGAVEMRQVLTVDAKGNVFIPGFGPVQVQGASAGEMNRRIQNAVHAIYPDNVNVYTNLQGIQPVAVYVTGYVDKPGRYAGVPSDSMLYFLAQAGGIEPVSGSFRQIDVMRDGERIAQADLYTFLIDGELARPQFQDGDTIIVRRQGPSVAATGEVDRPYAFEFQSRTADGAALLDVAPVRPAASHALVRGIREGEPFSDYVSLEAFRELTLHNGDDIVFTSDQRDERIVVQVEGSYLGASRYVLPRDASLQSFLDAVPVPRELTATDEVSIRREQVAERQRMALEDSLQRLESTYLGASSSSPEEAEIRTREAELITEFVERARNVEPSGRLVVASGGEVSDIRLRDGDVITIPEQSDSVLVSGEVIMPQSLVFERGHSVRDYIDQAGGFTARADDERILVVSANGEVSQSRRVRVQPGDEILVLPEVPTKNLQLAANLTQILYQVAIAAKVALDL